MQPRTGRQEDAPKLILPLRLFPSSESGSQPYRRRYLHLNTHFENFQNLHQKLHTFAQFFQTFFFQLGLQRLHRSRFVSGIAPHFGELIGFLQQHVTMEFYSEIFNAYNQN